MWHHHESPHRERHQHHNAALDAMSCTLKRATRSPFFNKIERTKMPRHFTRPPFTIYDGKTDLVEHVSHYIKMICLFSKWWVDVQNVPIQPQSHSNKVVQWFKERLYLQFQGADAGLWSTIHNVQHGPSTDWCVVVMRIRGGETIWSYENKYWELYNKIRAGKWEVSSQYLQARALSGVETEGFTNHASSQEHAPAYEKDRGV